VPDPRRRRIVRNAAGVGLATGAYGLSFGALSVAAGLSPVQTMVLSLVMFTGGSQFALVLVLGQGGTWPTAASSAAMLGSRNVFYGPRVAELLARPRGWRRLLTAQVTVDETVAMALGQKDDEDARLAFWATAAAIYPLWNLGTLAGAVGAALLPDPKVFGLDAAAPAAFLALLAPRLRGRAPWLVGAAGAAVALTLVPVTRPGVPVIVAALVAVVAGARGPREAAGRAAMEPG